MSGDGGAIECERVSQARSQLMLIVRGGGGGSIFLRGGRGLHSHDFLHKIEVAGCEPRRLVLDAGKYKRYGGAVIKPREAGFGRHIAPPMF